MQTFINHYLKFNLTELLVSNVQTIVSIVFFDLYVSSTVARKRLVYIHFSIVYCLTYMIAKAEVAFFSLRSKRIFYFNEKSSKVRPLTKTRDPGIHPTPSASMVTFHA